MMGQGQAIRLGSTALPSGQGWRLCGLPAGTLETPGALDADAPWLSLPEPMPVGAALTLLGQPWPDAGLDGLDWVYQCQLPAPCPTPEGANAGDWAMSWSGLATHAEVWLDECCLARTDHQFLPGQVSLGDPADWAGRMLTLVFRSLDRALQAKRPRPSWKAPMVRNQQLRWVRTSLWGRCPSWMPDAPLVGPVGPMALHGPALLTWSEWRMAVSWVSGQGRLRVQAQGQSAKVGALAPSASLRLRCGEAVAQRALPVVVSAAGELALQADLAFDDVQPWWPHTHGQPELHQAEVCWQWPDGTSLVQPLSPIGFRSVALDTTGGDFSLSINGRAVFARGVNLLPPDTTQPELDENGWRAFLQPYVDAGMNMLRLPGNTFYGSPDFYRACDALGLMVWQDFMFSNLDYPGDDAAFEAQVHAEVAWQTQRLSGHASLVLWCGNSEVSQQALMYAAPRSKWAPPLFHDKLPAWLAQAGVDVPYWPSSVHGGSFPCRADVGTTSYYGVGVYLRDLADARRSGLRFATECLGLSNEPATPRDGGWVPNDPAIGGDFVAVRDHYMRQLFEMDPAELAAQEPERYRDLAQVTSAEVMAATMAEWRRDTSACRGALIWFGRDVQPGAGFGILDHQGRPKAVWHALKRVLQPRALSFSDEGGNGLFLHGVNETALPADGLVTLTLWRADGSRVDEGVVPLSVAPWSVASVPAGDAFEWFLDINGAYRFGPPPGHVLSARWVNEHGAELACCIGLPAGWALPAQDDLGWALSVQPSGGGDSLGLDIQTRGFAQSVLVDAPGWVPDDQAFHLLPGVVKRVQLTPVASAPSRVVRVTAVNARQGAHLALPAGAASTPVSAGGGA